MMYDVQPGNEMGLFLQSWNNMGQQIFGKKHRQLQIYILVENMTSA